MEHRNKVVLQILQNKHCNRMFSNISTLILLCKWREGLKTQ